MIRQIKCMISFLFLIICLSACSWNNKIQEDAVGPEAVGEEINQEDAVESEVVVQELN